MNPTIYDLKQRCRKQHDSEPYAKYVIRYISIYVTWLLVRTPITANQVTLLQIAFGIIGAIFFGFGQFVLGVVFLQFGFILDCCDGEVARWNMQESKAGEYLDLIGHRIVIPLYFFGLGIGTGYIVFGFFAALFSQKFVSLGESGTQKQRWKWFFLYPGSMNVITIGAVFGLLPYVIIAYGVTIPIGRLIQVNRTFKRLDE